MQHTSVSVCIATYNGERFLHAQLDSILKQLDLNDEVIIVDDCSADGTLEVINEFNDSRIRVHSNGINIGAVHSFEKAISIARNEFIFLSDQDDIWLPGRLHLMTSKLLETNAQVLFSNFNLIDSNNLKLESIKNIKLSGDDSTRYFRNIIGVFLGKRSYYGCAMAMRKNIRNIILPIPKCIESHDIWIALAANLLHSNYHLMNETLSHRIHGANLTTSNRSVYKKLKSRVIFFISIIILILRIHKKVI